MQKTFARAAAIAAVTALTACTDGGESLSKTAMPPPPSVSEAPPAPTPAAAATITADFTCENGAKLHVVFDNTANTATVTTGTIKNLVLPIKPSGSGYWYSDGRHGLRGKGKDVMWEVGRMVPIKCTED